MDRMDRINQQLKEEISNIILRDLSDPRFEMVTITDVKTSRDLRNTRVYFSVLGPAPQVDSVKKGLQRAAGMIRRLVGQRVNLRNTPEISFSYDDSIESGMRMEKTLKEIQDEYEENH